jgi:hypothetical protein
MGFYLLPKGTHRKMDSIRARLFWRGAGDDFKYHMVKWSAVCRPKQFGGLGIVNTQILNECLMTKWMWKLYHQKESLWVRLLTVKYMRGGDFFRSKEGQGSQFWNSLHKVKHLFKWGAIHKVGNGKLTHFWSDVWVKSSSLRVYFPRLYVVCYDREGSVYEYANKGGN